MEFAKKCADQVIYLANGKMIDQGATKHFFSHPKTEELKRFLELTRGVDHLLP
jgi:ABC-type polar amino acid transport system ATPase subunit